MFTSRVSVPCTPISTMLVRKGYSQVTANGGNFVLQPIARHRKKKMVKEKKIKIKMKMKIKLIKKIERIDKNEKTNKK